MGYLFAILGGAAILAGAYTSTPPTTDIKLILGAIYWLIAAVFYVGAGIIFRMDYHSKKDRPK